MITVENLTKRYGPKTAVADLSFTAPAGKVTGFLGPNGAGKSTTMRMIVGLDRPSAGRALVNGRPYTSSTAPLAELGALLEAKAVHPGRTARAHLRTLAATHGISNRRVDEVIEMVGLTGVAKKRVKGFSLGMGQRLGIAVALLGDPETVMLDEPVNGLDPDGVRWVRTLLRRLADEGRTVFVSSHLMSEMALVADRLIVIGKGRLIADTTVAEITAQASGLRVTVRSPQAATLQSLVAGNDASATRTGPDTLTVDGLEASRIGELAAGAGIVLHELTPQRASLEEAFMELTHDAVEYTDTTAGRNAR